MLWLLTEHSDKGSSIVANRHVCLLQKAGYVGKVKIGMDVAASEFFENEKYNLDFKAKTPDPEQIKTGPELQEQYSAYCKQYPIISIEDPFDQDDFDSYANFTSEGVCQVRPSPSLLGGRCLMAHVLLSRVHYCFHLLLPYRIALGCALYLHFHIVASCVCPAGWAWQLT